MKTHAMSQSRKGKHEFNRTELRQTAKNLPFKDGKNCRDLAIKTGMSKTTLQRMTKKENARAHNIRPSNFR